jgi:colicin import membrane protein
MSIDTIQPPKPITPHDRTADPFHIGFRYVQQGDDWVQVPLTEEDFLHPQEDDFFVSNLAHKQAIAYLGYALQFALRDRPNVKVYPEHRVVLQDDLKAMCPDLGVYGNYYVECDLFEGTLNLQELGITPLLLVEVTSPSTRHIDRERKPPLYDEVGVPYLLMFDFYTEGAEVVAPELFAMRRTRKGFVIMPQDPEFGVWIPTVELWIKFDGIEVIAFDLNKRRIEQPAELKPLLDETRERLETEKQRAETEKQRADELEKAFAAYRAKFEQAGPNGASS